MAKIVLQMVSLISVATSLSFVDDHGVDHMIPSYPFALGNASFSSFMAPALFLASGAGVSDITSAVAGRVMFVDMGDRLALNIGAWANACQFNRCSAMAVYTSSPNLQSVLEMSAWTFRTSQVPFTNLPVVAVGAHDATSWAILVRQRGDIYVDTSINPAMLAITKPSLTILAVILFVVCALNLVRFVIKLPASALDMQGKLRPIPSILVTAMSGGIYLSVGNLVVLGNLIFSQWQGLPNATMLFFTYFDYGVGQLCRLHAGWLMIHTKAVANGKQEDDKRHIGMMTVYVAIMFIWMTVGTCVPIVAAAMQEIPFTFFTIYLLLILPNVVVSLVNTTGIVSLIISMFKAGGGSPAMMAEKRSFAVRWGVSTLIGYSISISGFVFLASQSSSSANFVSTWFAHKFCIILLQTLSSAALLKHKPSIIDRWTTRGTKVKPQEKYDTNGKAIKQSETNKPGAKVASSSATKVAPSKLLSRPH